MYDPGKSDPEWPALESAMEAGSYHQASLKTLQLYRRILDRNPPQHALGHLYPPKWERYSRNIDREIDARRASGMKWVPWIGGIIGALTVGLVIAYARGDLDGWFTSEVPAATDEAPAPAVPAVLPQDP
ncbi:hypothetical protein BH23VER1_BH23VER1_13420 [soil metagenome]